jgi:hypothetical protein
MNRLLIGYVLSMFASCTYSYDGYIDISTCPTVSIVVGNIDDASGWGGHFSTSSYSNGYGGSSAECHLTGADSGPQTGTLVVLCYDGYTSWVDHVDQFRLDLGPRSEVDQVEFKLSARGVSIDVLKHSTSSFTSDENPYVINTFFTLGESAGFCRESMLYYQANGNLANQFDRGGSGYTMSVNTID